MSAEYGWLPELCDDLWPFIAKPFALKLDGALVTIATNGRVMLGVPGRHADDATQEQIDGIAQQRKSLPTSEPRAFSFPAFRAFLGLPVGPTEPCTACKGRGRLDCEECEGDGIVECRQCRCGEPHQKRCARCDGVGWHRCPDCTTPESETGCVPVRLFGVLFDRRLIAPAIARLAAETVTWQNDGPTRAAVIRAEAWWLAIMPLREDRTFEKHRLAPVFDAAAVTQ